MRSPIRTPLKCSSIINSATNKNSNYEVLVSTDGVKVKVAVMFTEKYRKPTLYGILYFFNCRVRQTGTES